MYDGKSLLQHLHYNIFDYNVCSGRIILAIHDYPCIMLLKIVKLKIGLKKSLMLIWGEKKVIEHRDDMLLQRAKDDNDNVFVCD